MFTREERQAISDRITELEIMRLLGGEATSVDESGEESVLVMPLDDGPPQYVIRKQEHRFYLVSSVGETVVASDRLEEILKALP